MRANEFITEKTIINPDVNWVGPEFDYWMLSDAISVNWTSIAQLRRFNGAYLVGGGRNECLQEVELLMSAFNVKYKRIDRLVYGQ